VRGSADLAEARVRVERIFDAPARDVFAAWTSADLWASAKQGGRGEFTLIDPPRRLAFTWTWENPSECQRVAIEFVDLGSQTHVILTNHSMRASAAAQACTGSA
jgi:uncharacterized protein YndB with AHSA1/START domain